MPSERQLSEQLGISRVTIRKSLNELVQGGFLTRRQGARTFVSVKSRLEKRANNITGFSEGVSARGKTPGTVWIFKGIVPPAPKDTIALGIAPDQFVLKLHRVRLADGEPIAVESAVLPADMIGGTELIEDSLYATLDSLNLRPSRGYQRIYADAMDAGESRYLNSQPGEPLLVSERKCFLANGDVIEFTETRYKGDSFDFVTEIG